MKWDQHKWTTKEEFCGWLGRGQSRFHCENEVNKFPSGARFFWPVFVSPAIRNKCRWANPTYYHC